MISFPPPLEAFLLHYIKEEFYRGTKREIFIDRPFQIADLHFFSKGVAELSELFTTERGELQAGYLNQPQLRAAYLLYFLPINFAKATYVFQQFPDNFFNLPHFRILDLGCGPASASIAFLHHLKKVNPTAKVEITLVDQNEVILRDAKKIIGAFPKIFSWETEIKVHSFASEARKFRPPQKYDVILLSHLLNEMVQLSAENRAQWLFPKIEQGLTPRGIVAILEPALKRPTRELMALRNHLIETKELCVLTPCLHQQICPMLAGTKNDWCHFYCEWEEPGYLQKLDKLIKNHNRFLKVAYLLLGMTKEIKSAHQRVTQKHFRVVSNRMATREKTEIVLCGPSGRLRINRLNRDRSPVNAVLDSLRRGDMVELPGFEGKGFEVERQWRVTKRDPIKRKQFVMRTL